MPSMSSIFKDKYCRGDVKACARYLVAIKIGREKVPANLYPNQLSRVPKLIKTK
jgi:hypothetical protein